MDVVVIKTVPSRRDLRVFAGLLVVFMPILGWVLPGMGPGLVWAAAFAAACAALSLAFNRDRPSAAHVWGLIIPALLLAIWGAFRLGSSGDGSPLVRQVVLWAFAGAGLAGAAATLASDRFGARLYKWWMYAALPIGWTVSHLLLGIAFFLVIAPIGLITKLFGRDPMQRRFEPGRATYWEPHAQVRDPRRYFRQF